MSSTNTIFTGNSRYASDFTAVIDRSVAIASLPLTQMNNQRSVLGDRSTELNRLDNLVAGLQRSVTTLDGALGQSSYSASLSNGGIVSATLSSGVREGSYSIEVTDMGSQANTLSKTPGGALGAVTDPATQDISSAGPFKLFLNTADPASAITVTPSSDTLNALADAVNAASPDVHATVVNMGGSANPDYRLSIQSAAFGANTIQLKDSSGNDLLDQPSPGTPVKYKPNGGAEVTSNSRTALLAPGLTVSLLKQSDIGVATTISVTRGSGSITGALSNFVAAYNSVVSELDSNRGKGTGALKGDSLISSISQALRNVTGYSASGGGGLDSLTALGLSFDQDGVLSIDTNAFSDAVQGHMDELSAFLGGASTGGFLKAASDAIASLEDPTNGAIKNQIDSVRQQITDQDSRIADEQERIDTLKSNLQERMAAADALIAQMEQQVTYMTNLFDSMKNSGYNN